MLELLSRHQVRCHSVVMFVVVTASQECDGLVVSLEGPSRYEFAHEVPPVTGERISLTWRWFDEDFLQRLHEREAELLLRAKVTALRAQNSSWGR